MEPKSVREPFPCVAQVIASSRMHRAPGAGYGELTSATYRMDGFERVKTKLGTGKGWRRPGSPGGEGDVVDIRDSLVEY